MYQWLRYNILSLRDIEISCIFSLIILGESFLSGYLHNTAKQHRCFITATLSELAQSLSQSPFYSEAEYFFFLSSALAWAAD